MHVLTVNIRVKKNENQSREDKTEKKTNHERIQQPNITRGLKKKKEKRKNEKETEKISSCTSSFGFIAVAETSRHGRQSIAIVFVCEKVAGWLTIGRRGKFAGRRVRRESTRRARGPLAAEHSRENSRGFRASGGSGRDLP